MRIVWSRPAVRNMQDIHNYLMEHSGDPERAVGAILKGVERLAEQPYMGRPGHIAGTRELVIARQPYIVVYGVIEDKRPPEIAIYHVYHSSQNWQVYLDEEE
jgi:toxin ParE1/3/4